MHCDFEAAQSECYHRSLFGFKCIGIATEFALAEHLRANSNNFWRWFAPPPHRADFE